MNEGTALKAFIDSVSSPPTKVAIIGPFLSLANEYIASVSKHWNLVQVIPYIDYIYVPPSSNKAKR